MKTKTFFINSIKYKPLLKWEDHLKSFWLLLSSSLAACLPTGITFAHLGIRDTLNALKSLIRLSNKRRVVGTVLMMVGIFGIFLHHLFFSESIRTEWYFTNNYYFYFTIRPYVVSIFWSAAFILFMPAVCNLAWIPFSLWNSIGWCGLIHYSFFVNSNEEFWTFPHWSIIACGVTLGFAIVMTLDALLYWENHKVRGNHTRFVGLAEMDLDPKMKEPMYKSLAKEFRQNQKMI